jgi:hypothetical protein
MISVSELAFNRLMDPVKEATEVYKGPLERLWTNA